MGGVLRRIRAPGVQQHVDVGQDQRWPSMMSSKDALSFRGGVWMSNPLAARAVLCREPFALNRDCRKRALNPLDNRGDALADAYAHGAERIAASGFVELIEGCGYQAGAAGAERVADGDGSAVGVDMSGIVRQA